MDPTKVSPFAVEQSNILKWMDAYETGCKYNIAETCAASISLSDLSSFSESSSPQSPFFGSSIKLNYGAIRGSQTLRTNLANLYSSRSAEPLDPSNILITNGAIGANLLVFYALIGQGDHVICQYPTYQQLYSVPRRLGANVSLWHPRNEDDWEYDVSKLQELITPETKLLVINNPQNPTGAILSKQSLQSIIEIASKHNIVILSDEVYRPLFHGIGPLSSSFPPSMINLSYPLILTTGSLSKSYALAGIRVGWVASRSSDLVHRCSSARDYTTISVSQIDDHIASYALGPNVVHSLLARNIELAKTNLAILEIFINKQKEKGYCRWKKPIAGTTAFVKFLKGHKSVDDVQLCKMLHEMKGVLWVPGSECFGNGESEKGKPRDFSGYVRIGYCCETAVLKEGLEKVDEFIEEAWEKLSVAEDSAELLDGK
ncbi:MAG: hypothetical protein Q9190_006741 [Brigantiaea leucoxantha]